MKMFIRCIASMVVMLALPGGTLAQAVDVEAERAALRKVDEAWAETAKNGDVEAFLAMVDKSGSMLSPHSPILEGTEAFGKWATTVMSNPGYALTWTPTTVEVAKAGDFGFTIGTYELELHDPQGNPVKDSGKYMTIWKKQSDGSWKVLADMFNTNLPPKM